MEISGGGYIPTFWSYFQVLLLFRYLYTDICEVSDLNLFEVTHAAKSLGLDDLEKHCAEAVKGRLSATNVLAFTSQALQFEAKENTKVCREYFRKNTLEVIKTKEFVEISLDVLLTLCSSEGIACSELELFLACMEWAKKECERQKREGTPENLRAVLGDVLTKIRFPSMPKQDLEDVVIPLEILTYEEVGRIIVGWKKKEKRTEYSDELRTETVKVSEKASCFACSGGHSGTMVSTMVSTVASQQEGPEFKTLQANNQ